MYVTYNSILRIEDEDTIPTRITYIQYTYYIYFYLKTFMDERTYIYTYSDLVFFLEGDEEVTTFYIPIVIYLTIMLFLINQIIKRTSITTVRAMRLQHTRKTG